LDGHYKDTSVLPKSFAGEANGDFKTVRGLMAVIGEN
jgi:hypothetical protein